MLPKSLAIFLLLFLLVPLSAYAAGADDARQFVDSLGKHVVDLVNGGGGKDQKQQQLRQMFTDNVDIAWMAQFAVARGWSTATDDQKQRYVEAYKQYLLAHYTTNFSDYTGSKYTITGVKDEAEGQYLVSMKIKTPTGGQQDVDAGYRVRLGDSGQFKITDIIIEGVSLITTERSEFSAVLQQKGIDGLIGVIQSKTQSESSTK